MALELPDCGKVRRTGYRFAYQHYADQFSVSIRTVKRWAKFSDPAPLDDVEGLYVWWTRHFKKPCPEGILGLVVSERKEEPEPEPVVDVSDDEVGLDSMLTRLQEMEVMFSRKAGQPGQAKPWLDTVSRITVTISKLREEQEKHGKLIPKELAEAMIGDFFQPIEQGIRGMYRTLCNVTGLIPSPKCEEDWNLECDRMFGRFGQEVFRGAAA